MIMFSKSKENKSEIGLYASNRRHTNLTKSKKGIPFIGIP